jgi:hypothetical protein
MNEHPLNDPLPEADGTAEANKEKRSEGGYTYDEIPAWSEPLVCAYAAERVAQAVAEERERCLAIYHQGGARRSEKFRDWAGVDEAIGDGFSPATSWAAGRESELRRAVKSMAALLAGGEWAEHVSADDDAQALEQQITRLLGDKKPSAEHISATVAAERERCANVVKALDNDYLRASPCRKALARAVRAIEKA